IEVVSVSASVSASADSGNGDVTAGVIDRHSRFTVAVPVMLGINEIMLTVTDGIGKQTTQTITIERDETLIPTLSLTSPAGDAVVTQDKLNISGSITSRQLADALTVTLNGVQTGVLTALQTGLYRFDFSDVQLGLGQNPLSIKVTSPQGEDQLNFVVTYQDIVSPQLVLNQSGSIDTNSDSLRFDGTISDDNGIGSVTVVSSKTPTQVFNATIESVVQSSGSFSVSVPLKEGENKLTFIGKDSSGNETKAYLTVNQINTAKPILTLSEPQNEAQVDTSNVTVSGFVATSQPMTELTITLDGVATSTLVQSQTNRYQFSFADVSVVLGVNALVITVDSPKGRDSEILNLFFVDTQAPVLVLSSPSSQSTELSTISIKGQVTDNHIVTGMTASSDQYNGQTFGVTIDAQGQFEAQIPLKTGTNQISLNANDKADNTATAQVTVNKKDTLTPEVTITSPADGATVTQQQISVVGTITTGLPESQLTVKLSNASLTELRSIAPNVWQFTFDNVGLVVGQNPIPIEVHRTQGVDNSAGIS
ncbi:MAG: hypothetical protein MJK04_28765, partial [Psychrosphaera sp.]|nr:hypothetical protein [Psychrosphaera sp.]